MFEEEDDEFMEGNLKGDIERFENYLSTGEIGFIDSDQMELIIDYYLFQSQYTKANAAAELALSTYPYNEVFKLRRAQAISALGQLKEALTLLSEIKLLESHMGEYLLTKASIFSQLRDHKRAIKFFKEALEHSSTPEDKDEIFLDLAFEYEAENDYASAIQILLEAVKNNPNNEGALYELAFCYDIVGEYDQAIKSYSDFIDNNPYSFTAWYNLGNTYSKKEDYHQAIWAYEYSIIINDDFGPAYYNLGNSHMGIDQFEQAIEAFDRCLAIDGDDAMVLCNVGECYEQLSELEKAESFYRRSLELAPQLPDAWLGLGIVEDLKGDTVSGIKMLLKANDLDPNNSGILQVLAGAYEKLEDFEQACNYYNESLMIDPSDEEGLKTYILLLCRIIPMVEVLNFLESYAFEFGENKKLNLLKVHVLYELGRGSEAYELFKDCVFEDVEQAKELYLYNPKIMDDTDFTNLTNQ